ncbi:MAG: phosphoribosylformylglycinamidine synthase subunit PurS [Elusimicrobia bacterium]|nr:phosphoribosylformylglycinamidine synthase subunit PurS [Elusimicrobiota bacterium]
MTAKNGAGAQQPASVFRVEVTGKPGFPDAAGNAIAAQFPLLGLPAPADVRVCPVYEITGKLTQREIELAARDLLADPVTQDYRIGDGAISAGFLIGPHWRVEVWLKASVSDPVEASVRKGLADLGLPTPERVRCGTAYKIAGRMTAAQVEKAAKKILSNPVIHRVTLASP